MKKKDKVIVRCLNCGTEITDNFCPHCGQKAKVKRLKIREIISDLINSIIGGDNKFLNTIIALCTKPGHMTREYLQGHRSRYYNPLQMLIWMVSIYAVLSLIAGSDPLEVTDTIKSDVEINDKSQMGSLINMVSRCYSYIKGNKLYFMITNAIIAVWPFYFIYRKTKISRPDGDELPLNHTEQFYTQLYGACIDILVAILLIPVSLIPDSEHIVKGIDSAVSMLYFIILYKQLYRIGWMKGIIRTVFAGILAFTYLIILIIILVILVACICYLIYGEEGINLK